MENRNSKKIEYKIIRSATLEMVKSIHVIVDPWHHAHCHEWTNKTICRLPPNLKDNIMFIGKYAEWAYVMDLVASITSRLEEADDIQIVLHNIRKMKPEIFAAFFLGLSTYQPKLAELRKYIADPAQINYELFEECIKQEEILYFFNNLEDIRRLLIETMEQYWEQIFRYEWDSIDACLLKFSKRGTRLIERYDPLSYICSLHKDIFMQDGQLIFRKEPSFSIPISNIGKIVITPSVFSYPHLYGNIIGDKVYIALNMNYNAVRINEMIPVKTLQLLHILEDETRYKMIKILWKTDATTGELADILTLSASTVSLHLKLMKDADIVEIIKVGKHTYYKLNKEPFFCIQKDILDSFE